MLNPTCLLPCNSVNTEYWILSAFLIARFNKKKNELNCQLFSAV